MADNIKVNQNALDSYSNKPEEQCWYDDCACKPIPPADCDALAEENNQGVGRFACLSKQQSCYNAKFFTKFLQKLTCQLDHIIQNICGLWDMVECLRNYTKSLGNLSANKTLYLRNSSVSSASFYHNMSDTYDVNIYMDSTTGVVAGESDDGHRQMTDQKYRCFVRWCADGNGLNASADNTMLFTLYSSNEFCDDNMVNQRSLHWQMTGVTDGAMSMSDTIIVPAGQYIKLRVQPGNSSGGTFRVHQFKVEYTPVVDSAELSECLRDN